MSSGHESSGHVSSGHVSSGHESSGHVQVFFYYLFVVSNVSSRLQALMAVNEKENSFPF